MNNKMKKAAVAFTMALSLGSVAGFGIANAQGPNGQTGTAGRVGAGSVLMCSTTNYTDVAAKAIGIQSADLRKALVGGKNLTEILSSTKVTVQNVEDALKAAYTADLDQALKDGLITQQEYDQIKSRLTQTAPAANATPAATPSAVQPAQPGQPGPRGQFGNGPRRGLNGVVGGVGFLRIPEFNEVKPLIVASKAIGISCADLVKAMETGQSIAQVATSKNVQVQTVIDALTAAEKAAITQDVSEGLLAQVQADARIAQLVNRAGSLVYDAHLGGRGGPGGPGQDGFGQGGPGRRNGQLQDPNGQNPPSQPQAPSGLPSDPSSNGSDAPQQAPDING